MQLRRRLAEDRDTVRCGRKVGKQILKPHLHSETNEKLESVVTGPALEAARSRMRQVRYY